MAADLTDTHPTAGAILHARRISLGLSQRQAAAVCGVPQPMWSRIETGATDPTIGTLSKLLRGLGSTLELRAVRDPAEARREKMRSQWLNLAVAGELVRDPDRVIRIAQNNLATWRPVHADTPSILGAFERWAQILEQGAGAVLEVLTSHTEEAADLRQNSPFAGVLDEATRLKVLHSFRRTWAQQHDTDEVVA